MAEQLERYPTLAGFLDRCRSERAAAGFPRYVEDATALDKLITIVAGHGHTATGTRRPAA
jgi:hypothetical protein